MTKITNFGDNMYNLPALTLNPRSHRAAFILLASIRKKKICIYFVGLALAISVCGSAKAVAAQRVHERQRKLRTWKRFYCYPKKKRSELQGKQGLALTWDAFTREAKKLAYIAGPMVVATTSLYLLLVISKMMVGHLGELALSSAAIAISSCNVTGMSLLNGMASALETLCGQAYGAQQYRKVGNQIYGAMFSRSLILVALIVSFAWINMGKLLILIGQDPIIAHEAGKFTLWLVPTLSTYAVFQPLSRHLQIQSLTIPMLVSSCITLLLHRPQYWLLVFKSGLENLGGALAISISNWLSPFCSWWFYISGKIGKGEDI